MVAKQEICTGSLSVWSSCQRYRFPHPPSGNVAPMSLHISRSCSSEGRCLLNATIPPSDQISLLVSPSDRDMSICDRSERPRDFRPGQSLSPDTVLRGQIRDLRHDTAPDCLLALTGGRPRMLLPRGRKVPTANPASPPLSNPALARIPRHCE